MRTVRVLGMVVAVWAVVGAGSGWAQTRRHYQLDEPAAGSGGTVSTPSAPLRRVTPPGSAGAAPTARPAATRPAAATPLVPHASTSIIPAPAPVVTPSSLVPPPSVTSPSVTPSSPLPAVTVVAPAGGPMLPDFPKRPAASVTIPKQTRVNLAWQIALESADFSPGILDGHFKRKSTMALSEFASRYFPGATPFDLRVFHSLKVDPDDAVTTYTIVDDDAAQVGGTLPDDWNAKARLDRLRYESLVDCMAEKFHCSRVLLETLNPGVKMGSLEPGQMLNVPNLRPFPIDNKPTVVRRYVEGSFVSVNLAEKAIRIFDRENRELALFHCSIAKDKAKLPRRDTVVKAIAAPNPNYTFDPRNWPEVDNVSQVLTIPPGPRNPVGLAWVSLDLPGYGIHGSPKPELIGKTGSHGCFRLTNWDALKFAGMVKEGMVVRIENPEKGE